MTHNENIKTFEAISKHLEMEEDHIHIYAPPNVAFITKGCGPRGKKPNCGKKPKKGPHPSQNSRPKGGYAKKHKANSTGAKDVARVKCYNCEKKGQFAWDCLQLAKIPISTKTPQLYICSHAFVANSLP